MASLMGVLLNQRQMSTINGTARSANVQHSILDIPMYAPSQSVYSVLLFGGLLTSKFLRLEYTPQAHPASMSINWLCFSNLTFTASSDAHSDNLDGRKAMFLVNVSVGKEIKLTPDEDPLTGVKDYDAVRLTNSVTSILPLTTLPGQSYWTHARWTTS
jgi:hypothetical protein